MDFSFAWSLYQRHKDWIGYAMVGLLLLALGFQWGRITSPYYAAHPIIFKEADGGTSSGGSPEELRALQEAGQAIASEEENQDGVGETSSVSFRPQSTVAAAAATQAPASKTQGSFVGSKNSDLYHHTSCATWKRIKPENQVWFQSREEAETAGYKPTKCTAQLLGI